MNKITKVLKAIFFSGKFSTEWRKNNLHNFTTPVTKFKMDAVKVGKGTYGKLFVVTRDYQNVKLSIGNYCSIAGGVKFLLSGNHQYDIISTYPYELLILNSHEAGIAVAKGDIVVGDDVWIGANVSVLPGVTIGSNTIIGAGSVVNKDIPEGVIAVGNPCKVMRKITEEDKKKYPVFEG